MTIVFVAVTFTVSRGLVSRAIDRGAHRLITDLMISVVIFAGFLQNHTHCLNEDNNSNKARLVYWEFFSTMRVLPLSSSTFLVDDVFLLDDLLPFMFLAALYL